MLDDADVLSRAAQRIGRVLHGKYRLDAVLGIGGMSVVYAATHRNQKQFAVKVLHSELAVLSDVRARFLREGYAANSVGHEGVVAVLDDDVDETGTPFLVMDLLRGADVELLRSRWGGKLPLQLVLEIARQVLEVLDAAHCNAVVHRDIKPANFFVLQSGELRLLDFGVARVRERASNGDVTRSGAVLGSPAFMAPEQAAAKNGDVDARTDLWALGASLFTLLSGQFVHDAESGEETLIQAATMPARSLASIAPELPPSVIALVDQALQFEPAARWGSAAAMGQAVARAQYDLFEERSLEPLRTCVAGFGAPRYRISSGADATVGASETISANVRLELSQAGHERASGSSKPVVAIVQPRLGRSRRGTLMLVLGAAALGVTLLARTVRTSGAHGVAVVPRSAPHQATQATVSLVASARAMPSALPALDPQLAPPGKAANAKRPRAAAPKAALAEVALGPSRSWQTFGAGTIPTSTVAPTPIVPARSNPLQLELQ